MYYEDNEMQCHLLTMPVHDHCYHSAGEGLDNGIQTCNGMLRDHLPEHARISNKHRHTTLAVNIRNKIITHTDDIQGIRLTLLKHAKIHHGGLRNAWMQ